MSPPWQNRNVARIDSQELPFPLLREIGFRLAAGSVKAARRPCARRREALTGSAASSTMGAEGMGASKSETRRHFYFAKGDISTLPRQSRVRHAAIAHNGAI